MSNKFTDLSNFLLNIKTGETIVSSDISISTRIYQHKQTSKSKQWKVLHNMNTSDVIVSVFSNNEVVAPDEISVISADEITLTFTTEISGIVNIYPLYNANTLQFSLPDVSPTPTPTVTPTVTPTLSLTPTPTVTPTLSFTPTISPPASPTPTVTPTLSMSVTPSVTPSISPSVTPTVTPTPSVSITPSVSSIPFAIFSAGEDKFEICSNTVILNGTSDNEGLHTYEWVQISGNTVTIVDSNTLNASYNNAVGGDKTFRLYVDRFTPKEQFDDIEIFDTPTTRNNVLSGSLGIGINYDLLFETLLTPFQNSSDNYDVDNDGFYVRKADDLNSGEIITKLAVQVWNSSGWVDHEVLLPSTVDYISQITLGLTYRLEYVVSNPLNGRRKTYHTQPLQSTPRENYVLFDDNSSMNLKSFSTNNTTRTVFTLKVLNSDNTPEIANESIGNKITASQQSITINRPVYTYVAIDDTKDSALNDMSSNRINISKNSLSITRVSGKSIGS